MFWPEYNIGDSNFSDWIVTFGPTVFVRTETFELWFSKLFSVTTSETASFFEVFVVALFFVLQTAFVFAIKTSINKNPVETF